MSEEVVYVICSSTRSRKIKCNTKGLKAGDVVSFCGGYNEFEADIIAVESSTRAIIKPRIYISETFNPGKHVNVARRYMTIINRD